jgi:hypothetical protein
MYEKQSETGMPTKNEYDEDAYAGIKKYINSSQLNKISKLINYKIKNKFIINGKPESRKNRNKKKIIPDFLPINTHKFSTNFIKKYIWCLPF